MSVSLVAFGGGTDSTAMLIEMVKRGEEPPHAILFADTGGEHPHTYAHIETFSRWLVDRQYPEITVVKLPRETLEEMCLRLGTLPAIAYGWKTCSLRYKLEPQEKWVNNDGACQAVLAAGGKITRLVGFEYGEERRMKEDPSGKFANRYPLIEWEMDRDDCRHSIIGAGIRLPGKSSCFFCPNMKKSEIRALADTYPALLQRALAMEANAATSGKSNAVGLGRRFSWADFISDRDTSPELPMDMPCDCYDGAAA